ncbi:phenol hydroxylase subunit [Acidocella sp.]|uniref:phenol hydroxylase subunit n=1 Tax=Acidocella sp. TaxID=50710 RepID=UPI003D0029B4
MAHHRQATAAGETMYSPQDPTAYVKILGTRSERFVEFEFCLGDEALTVELILPFTAFTEFCAARQARILPPQATMAAELDKLAWRAGQPGLLRPPHP